MVLLKIFWICKKIEFFFKKKASFIIVDCFWEQGLNIKNMVSKIWWRIDINVKLIKFFIYFKVKSIKIILIKFVGIKMGIGLYLGKFIIFNWKNKLFFNNKALKINQLRYLILGNLKKSYKHLKRIAKFIVIYLLFFFLLMLFKKGLAWNPHYENIFASGDAEGFINFWNVK